jgi:hypothetical protein
MRLAHSWQIALWALRIFALLTTALVVYSFVSNL